MQTDRKEILTAMLRVCTAARKSALRTGALGKAEAALQEERSLLERIRKLDEEIAAKRAEIESAAQEPAVATA